MSNRTNRHRDQFRIRALQSERQAILTHLAQELKSKDSTDASCYWAAAVVTQ